MEITTQLDTWRVTCADGEAPDIPALRALLVAHFEAAQHMKDQRQAARLAGVVVGIWRALGLDGEPYEPLSCGS